MEVFCVRFGKLHDDRVAAFGARAAERSAQASDPLLQQIAASLAGWLCHLEVFITGSTNQAVIAFGLVLAFAEVGCPDSGDNVVDGAGSAASKKSV